ncbi:MAG: hypothetical protein IPK99_15615 [Flavobacteriales bacterium]|nr:hypothetical protein [Flavobacteriales bacterium]
MFGWGEHLADNRGIRVGLCIADHRIDSDGRYVIQAKPFPTGNFGDAFSLYTPNDSIAPGLYGYGISFNGFNGFPPRTFLMSRLWYRAGMGLMLCDGPMFEAENSTCLKEP